MAAVDTTAHAIYDIPRWIRSREVKNQHGEVVSREQAVLINPQVDADAARAIREQWGRYQREQSIAAKDLEGPLLAASFIFGGAAVLVGITEGVLNAATIVFVLLMASSVIVRSHLRGRRSRFHSLLDFSSISLANNEPTTLEIPPEQYYRLDAIVAKNPSQATQMHAIAWRCAILTVQYNAAVVEERRFAESAVESDIEDRSEVNARIELMRDHAMEAQQAFRAVLNPTLRRTGLKTPRTIKELNELLEEALLKNGATPEQIKALSVKKNDETSSI